MKHTYPMYYQDFHCISGQCPCTCCAGWAIEIDDASIKQYRKKNIDTVDYKEKVFLQDGSAAKRCLNLDENGLCKLILQYGEDILCDTCRLFPRHTEEFEGVREHSLSISCPEVARMILSLTEPVQFTTAEDHEEDKEEYDEYEQEVYGALHPLREKMLAILQDSDKKLSEKCREILSLASFMQDELDGVEAEGEKSNAMPSGASLEELYSAMEEWEYTSDEFPELLAKGRKLLFGSGENDVPGLKFLDNGEYHASALELLDDSSLEMRLQQIIVYFIYAYFCGSAYDEYYYGMAQLAVAAAIHIKLLCEAHRAEFGELTDADMERITYLYARELEHSVPNVLATEAWMDEHRI